jgi:hypothetical protein
MIQLQSPRRKHDGRNVLYVGILYISQILGLSDGIPDKKGLLHARAMT